MLDLLSELNETGIPFKNLHWLKAPAYPYGILDDVLLIRGDDERLTIVEHTTSVELYAETINAIAETAIENWLDSHSFSFDKSRYWIDSEQHYQTLYEFEFIEKRGD